MSTYLVLCLCVSVPVLASVLSIEFEYPALSCMTHKTRKPTNPTIMCSGKDVIAVHVDEKMSPVCSLPRKNPLDSRTSIVRFMRYVILGWHENISSGGFLLAVNVFDRYVAWLKVSRPGRYEATTFVQARCVVAACILISSKYWHVYAFRVSEIAEAVSGDVCIDAADVRSAETDILNALKFKLGLLLPDACLLARYGPGGGMASAVSGCRRAETNDDLRMARSVLEMFASSHLYVSVDPVFAADAAYLLTMAVPTGGFVDLDVSAGISGLGGAHVKLAKAMWENWIGESPEDCALSLEIAIEDDRAAMCVKIY